MMLFKQICFPMVVAVIFVFNFTDFLPRKQITCDFRGQSFGLAVICFFPEDVNVSRIDYTVYLYKESKDPITVVSCMWPQGQEHVKCSVGSGYAYDELIYPDHISVQIINPSDRHLGMYECQLSGYKDLGQCQLSARQTVPTGGQMIQTRDLTTKTVLPSVSAEQVGDGDEEQKHHTQVQRSTTTDPACAVTDGKVHREETFGAGVGCGIGITVVLLLGVFLWRRCRHLIPNICLNVGKIRCIRYFKAPQQEENSEIIDGPAEDEADADLHGHLPVNDNNTRGVRTSIPCAFAVQKGLSEFVDGSEETEGITESETEETSLPRQTTSATSLAEKSDSESKPVVDEFKEKADSTNVDTQDPCQTSDQNTRGCRSTLNRLCPARDKADYQEQLNGTKLQISFTVKVEQHGEGLKEDLEESTVCNCSKTKSQGQAESTISLKKSNPKNSHITPSIGEQEVIQSIHYPGLSIGNLTAVLTSHDHNIQETSEKNGMGLHLPPESGPTHYFERNSLGEATLPTENRNQTRKNSNSLSTTDDFDIRSVKKQKTHPTSQQNNERLSNAQTRAQLSSDLETENNFSSLNGKAEAAAISKSKEMIPDIQEGESSPGAQVTVPAEKSLNIRSRVHRQPPD